MGWGGVGFYYASQLDEKTWKLLVGCSLPSQFLKGPPGSGETIQPETSPTKALRGEWPVSENEN